MSLELAIQAAEKGLAWLRESGPLYGLDVDKIDVNTLYIKSQCNCVLGQLGQEYSLVMSRLLNSGVVGSSITERIYWTEEHGFDKGIHGYFNYPELDEAWRLVLEADRAQ
jgi:hypothetical protein